MLLLLTIDIHPSSVCVCVGTSCYSVGKLGSRINISPFVWDFFVVVLSSQPVGWPVNFYFYYLCDFLIRIGISSAGWLHLLTLNFRKPKTFWILRYSVGGGVIQYGTGCVGRRGVHSISKGRGGGNQSTWNCFFLSRISHVTQQKIF